ncbi:MAG TPA: hypothetical protein VFZ37_01865 [Jiangellaceae bacterium]
MNQIPRALITVTVLALIGAAAAFALIRYIDGSQPFQREQCIAVAGDHEVRLSPEQAENAATIAAVAEQRNLPARAVTIALATAYQESDLYNLNYGDRDSLGLFQQRPSQGWGSAEQVQDPAYAAGAFYDELVSIGDYRDMEITDAAQAVQRSAFPDAYADHEEDARALASALSGYSEAALYCTFSAADYEPQELGEDGLTPRASAVLDEITATFGELPTGGFDPAGVSAGHIGGSAHYDGRAIDIFFRPHDDPGRNRAGWILAHWLAVHADRLDIATLIYDDMIWTARRADEGWRPYEHPSGDTTNVTLRHLDHVHVDVQRGR